MNFKNLSNFELEKTLKASVLDENKLKIQILHLLAEVERRRLYSKDQPSLFEYCVRVLKYSSAAAQRRIDSMRAMKLIPELEQKIISGELNLSSIAQAQSFFRHEAKAGKIYSVQDKKEVLAKLQNKSSKECVQELISISPQSVPSERRRELTIEKTELKVVLNKELVAKLDKIKALMSHRNPNMTDQELIEIMANALLEKIDPMEKAKRSEIREKKSDLKKDRELERSQELKVDREGKVDRELTGKALGQMDNEFANDRLLAAPALPMAEVKSRYVPAALKREVYLRDQGKCSHVNCESKRFLEFDHVLPFSMGGETTAENLRLLCHAHNQRAAIDQLGFEKMRPYFRN